MTGPTAPETSYDPALFPILFKIEDQHFWFKARNLIIAALVTKLTARFTTRYRFLEVGCGTGNVLRYLERAAPGGQVIGIDLFLESLRYARRRTPGALVAADIYHLPFHNTFEMIALFDVLEHLADDGQILQLLYDNLSATGLLLLTVPAHMSLWSYFDRVSHHYRRYEVNELILKLRGAGFEIEYLTQYMTSILPLVYLGRKIASKRGNVAPNPEAADMALATGEMRHRPGINTLLTLLLGMEARLIARGFHLPAGTSLLAVARKPAAANGPAANSHTKGAPDGHP